VAEEQQQLEPVVSPSTVIPVPQACPVYCTDGLDKEFRQSEIVSRVAQYDYDGGTGRISEVYHQYVIVANQDCDLLWDREARDQGKPGDLNGLIVYEAEPAFDMKAKLAQGRDIWARVIQNKDERYHYLEAVPAELDLVGQGIPPLILDLKRCFTLPVPELHRQCRTLHGAQRRCRLETSFRDHLQSRIAFYLQRVTLVRQHAKPVQDA
jgi:hypothetical protein